MKKENGMIMTMEMKGGVKERKVILNYLFQGH